MPIRQGERMGARGPECSGSYQRVKLRLSEQVHREYECGCGRVLRVRLSERTGEATVPRHRVEKQAAELEPTDIVKGPPCPKCGSDLWVIDTDFAGSSKRWLLCYGANTSGECVETMELSR